MERGPRRDPSRRRAAALGKALALGVVVGLSSVSGASAAPASQDIYAYEDANGRTVYVNGESAVPTVYKSRARRVSLEHVDLHEGLGNALRDRVLETHAALSGDLEACEGAKPAAPLARDSLVLTAEGKPRPLAIGLAALLLLLLVGPLARKFMSDEAYRRLLGYALPLVVATTTLGQVALRARSLSARPRTVAPAICDDAGALEARRAQGAAGVR